MVGGRLIFSKLEYAVFSLCNWIFIDRETFMMENHSFFDITGDFPTNFFLKLKTVFFRTERDNQMLGVYLNILYLHGFGNKIWI